MADMTNPVLHDDSFSGQSSVVRQFRKTNPVGSCHSENSEESRQRNEEPPYTTTLVGETPRFAQGDRVTFAVLRVFIIGETPILLVQE
jgi:hypothetical protein